MIMVVYAVAKFLGYSFWGMVGTRLATGEVDVGKGLLIGVVRWIIGLVFGAIIFVLALMFMEVNSGNVFFLYLGIYIPVRYLEWWIIHSLYLKALPKNSPNYYRWILYGIVLSFLLDFISPEWISEGRFCVGRCLC